MQNSTVVAALEHDPVPPDRECLQTTTDVLDAVVEFVKVTGLASAAAGTPFPSSNNTAAQALATANSAISQVQELQTKVKERRSSGQKVSLPAGDNVVALSWSPVMPTTTYEVRITVFGSNAAFSSAYSFHVVDGTEDFGSVQVRFDDVPVGTSFTYVVEAL